MATDHHAHDHSHHDPHQHGHDHTQGSPMPMADAAVRTARPTDAPAVGLTQAYLWQHEFADLLPRELLDQFTGPTFGNAWRRGLESPPSVRHRLLVATAGPQVVGYVSIGPAEEEPGLSPDTTGTILDGGVHPEARRAGHGSRLLNAAIDTLRASTDGLAAVTLWVLADAESTQAFLRASGFTPDGAWRDRVLDEEGRTAREVRLVADL
ncbi:MAG: N-acetyltransferase [Ornithinimicrobium sp.]|uniref:GNAT family N-acetyltransferase n=1 Tax=Ornithinimicrobium sp. TaxID=1977084 RepID=UPI0026DF787C|nr:N-acetyltransferase [Ornithinimicrobium sp.]MDO5740846.1 N-acetyltransferase [Ornithinimicrobium sp.]